MPFGLSTGPRLQKPLLTLSTISPGEDEEDVMSLGVMSPGGDEEGAMSPGGTGAGGWHLHSPGHSTEDPRDFGTMPFPPLTSCPEQLCVEATYRQKEKKKTNQTKNPTKKKLGKRI